MKNYTFRYLFDEGIEKNITIRASDERQSIIYTSVGHTMKFQLRPVDVIAQFLLFYRGNGSNTHYALYCKL